MERPVRGENRIDDVQVRRWLVDRERQRQRTASHGRVPVITVSREYGARGAAVGRIVAKRLSFQFWDRELAGEQQDIATLAAAADELAARGGAVLIGRGLGFLLDASRALRVRIVCPLEQRVAGLVEREGICEDTARATIAYADRARREFVQEVYCCDIDDVSGYDLWISTATISLEAAAAVIIAAYRYRFGEQVMSAIGHAQGGAG